MWKQSEIKKAAKKQLKGNFLESLGVTIIANTITALSSNIIIVLFSFVLLPFIAFIIFDQTTYFYPSQGKYLFIFIAALSSCVGILINCLLAFPIETGISRYFIEKTQGRSNFADLFFGFENRYKNIVKAGFLQYIFLFFWGVLLLIPGIIKIFSYSQTQYILAENPNISANKAITLSRKIMKGNKFKKLLFDISFIGWYILGLICFGFGVYLVIPYYRAASAELYIALRAEAINNNKITLAELEVGKETFA